MSNLDPIPIPPDQQWREFRIRRLPLICFSIVLLAVVLVWRTHVGGPVLIGEVEVVRSDVTSTLSGQIAELYVDRLEKVSKGQPIAKLLPVDPEVLQANLAGLSVDLKILRARMSLDEARNRFDYERLKLDWLNARVELAVAEANLSFDENEFQRIAGLWEQKVESTSLYERTKALRDARAREVSEKERLVAQLAERVAQLELPQHDNESEKSSWAESIAAQEARLLMMEGPITLRAAIDGFISDILLRPGDRVMAGLPIVSISAPQSTRIIGFVRQPLSVVPKPGDKVQIRTRGVPRKSAQGTITQVGAELRPLTPALSMRGFTNIEERGLPFLVSLPAELPVFPGEIVDLHLEN